MASAVLETAAANGLHDLARDALRVVRLIGFPVEERHVAFLVEAYVTSGRLKDAFQAVETQRRTVDFEITDYTTLAIRRWASQAIQNVDAAWNLLEDLHKRSPGPLHIASLNAVIGAAIDLEDMQRAIGMYQETTLAFGISPNVQTLNIILMGCLLHSEKSLADRFVAEFRSSSTGTSKPNTESYELLIQLCMSQPTYEDAFYHLEAMKASGWKPSANIYESIIKRTFEAFDTRWKLALEEMKEAGYSPSSELRGLLEGVKRTV